MEHFVNQKAEIFRSVLNGLVLTLVWVRWVSKSTDNENRRLGKKEIGWNRQQQQHRGGAIKWDIFSKWIPSNSSLNMICINKCYEFLGSTWNVTPVGLTSLKWFYTFHSIRFTSRNEQERVGAADLRDYKRHVQHIYRCLPNKMLKRMNCRIEMCSFN